MMKKYRLGFALLVCALLLVFAPAALASCTGDDGVEHEHHDWGDWSVTREPTCKEEGTKVKVCNRCGKEKEESIDALGHDWSDWTTTKEPTCSDEGTKVKTCHRCGKEKEETIEALGHDWSDWTTTKEATCDDAGTKVKTCARCGKEKEETIDALGHDWSDWTTAKEATCDEAGTRVKTCARCGKEKEETIEALGHDWSDWTTEQEATCEEAGKQTKVCARCGKTEEKAIDALGHDWSDWATAKEATCEEAGVQTRACARCGKTEEKAIDALGHSYEAQTTDPTCEKAGVITYTCTRCGNTYTEAGEAALGHEWGEWVVTEATDTAPATQTRTCARCGMDETEILAEAEKTGEEEPVTITFECGHMAENVPEPLTGKPGEAVTAKIEAPTHVNYTFLGWDQDIPETFPTEDMTIKAVWARGGAGVMSSTYKPALADVLKQLSQEIDYIVAIGNGEEKQAKATLVWDETSCPNYGEAAYDDTADGKYVFTPASAAFDIDGRHYEITEDLRYDFTLIVEGATSKDGLYTYRLNEDFNLTIAKYLGSETQLLTVPDKIDGYEVIGIGKDAFNGAQFIDVILPDGIQRIGESAFANCANLAALAVPDGVATIGDSAFANCPKLAALTLPDTLISLGLNTTLGDTALTALTLSASRQTTLTSATTYTRPLLVGEEGYDANDPTKTVTVTLPLAVTDLVISSPAATPFTLPFAYTVEKDHGITVTGGATLSVGAKLTNKGSISNAGTVDVAVGVTLDNNAGTFTNNGTVEARGTILTCAGTWSGADAKVHSKGSFVKDHPYELINYDHYECSVCGHTKKFTKPSLTVSYTGGTLYKTYDKSRNYQGTNSTTGKTEWLLNKTLKKSDFKVSTKKDDVTGKNYNDVSISLTGASLTKFSSADAGDYTLSLTLQLTGDDLEYYDLSKTNGKYYATVKISARINKRTVTITPSKSGTIKDSQGNERAYVASKAYGASDPSWFLFTQSGLLNLTTAEQQAGKKLYTGKLGREKGENVGTYKFTLGTLDFGNSNYDVKLNSEVFTITKKTISDSDIGMVTIGNQRYTGKEIKPTVTLRYGTMTLKEGTDFKVEYKDNVSAGSNTAKVKITGIGNFTGTKETTFSILNITDDFSKDTDDTDSYRHTGFDSGEFEDVDDEDGDSDGNASEDGNLTLDDEDFGSILFDRKGEAMPFTVFRDEDDLTPGQSTLTIIADPMVDEVTGESLFLEDCVRERYDELHLRLDTSLVQTLLEKGVTEVIYELEQADLRIPLVSLVSELPLPEEAPEAAADDEAFEDEFVIEEADDEVLGGDAAPEELVGEVESLEGAEVAPTGATMKVQTYDFCIEQADATGLSASETVVLENGELMMPAYRVQVRVVPEGAEQVPTGLTDENGEPITQYLAEPMPEGTYVQQMVLQLQPDGNLVTAPEGATAIFMSVEASAAIPAEETADEAIDEAEDEESDEAVDEAEGEMSGEDIDELTDSVVTPVEFIDVDGALVVQLPVEADGLYAVRAPEGWDPEAFMADEEEEELFEGEDAAEDEDEDFDEDFDDEGFDDEFEEI